jgi:hypothetical protein
LGRRTAFHYPSPRQPMQCIRELRNKLGDQDHSLIKTVPRRGYILDAEPASPGRPALKAAHSSGLRQPLHWIGAHFGAQGRTRQISIVAVALVFLALSVGYILTSFTAPGRSELFMPADAHRVAAVADSKGLPLPPFEIVKSDRAVSAEARGFVGIWVSDKGWVNSNRQVMLIITQVAGASAAGYIVHGPPQPRSAYQSPPHFHAFKAIVAGKSLSFDSLSGKYMASFADNGIELRLDFREGGLGVAALDPLWTLSGAEKVAARERARDD